MLFDSDQTANDTRAFDAPTSRGQQHLIGNMISMSLPATFPLRQECPPGACNCDRDALLSDPHADIRPLKLTREEERKLIARIESIASLADLKHITERMHAQLGIELQISPGSNEVRTVRGLRIQLAERPGLCRKIRQSIPAAVRRCLEKNPTIVYAILDTHDLLGAGQTAARDSPTQP